MQKKSDNTMKRNSIILIFLLISICNIHAQEKTKVLLVATYHFGGNTSDNIKVSNDNILSDKKQEEIKVVIEKLREFKPEKIYVENEPNRQVYWDSIYIAYRNGQNIELTNEIFQIGTKLARNLNLNQGVTCVDWHISPAKTFSEKQYEQLLKKMIEYYDENNIPDDEPESLYFKKTLERIQTFNQKIPSLHLLDVFKHLNKEEYLNQMFYANLTSFLDIDQYDLNVFWSQNNMIRNVNVYQNIIQDILKDKPKRVMIMYGAGHIKALRNYLEVHPKIEIVNTEEYLE
jgi:hypothetical protein